MTAWMGQIWPAAHDPNWRMKLKSSLSTSWPNLVHNCSVISTNPSTSTYTVIGYVHLLTSWGQYEPIQNLLVAENVFLLSERTPQSWIWLYSVRQIVTAATKIKLIYKDTYRHLNNIEILYNNHIWQLIYWLLMHMITAIECWLYLNFDIIALTKNVCKIVGPTSVFAYSGVRNRLELFLVQIN